MSRCITGFVPMEIPTVTHNALMPVMGRGGKPRIAKTPELHAAEAEWEARLGAGLDIPERPLHAPLRAEVRFAFRSNRRHEAGEPHVAKPDMDNLEKTLWDVLQSLGAIGDDCGICDKRVSKMWAEVPGVYVEIEEIGEA